MVSFRRKLILSRHGIDLGELRRSHVLDVLLLHTTNWNMDMHLSFFKEPQEQRWIGIDATLYVTVALKISIESFT